MRALKAQCEYRYQPEISYFYYLKSLKKAMIFYKLLFVHGDFFGTHQYSTHFAQAAASIID
jgi:hypothetical protein